MTIIAHSSLYYWWPVWALSLTFALFSFIENTRVIHVPSHTKTESTESGGYRLVADEYASKNHAEKLKEMVSKYDKKEDYDKRRPPRMSHHAGMGTLFLIVLLVVIGITNVPLRGLWSVIVIVIVILVSVILAVLGVWDTIFSVVGNLHIYIGMAGYLFFGVVLLIMWGVSTFIFDRQTYMTFTPGQMKVCEEVGGGEKAYDTIGMTIEKHRDDLFRHWVLGLGSGDLTVRTAGAQAHTITMPNVLRIGAKLKRIEDMQREKQVVT